MERKILFDVFNVCGGNKGGLAQPALALAVLALKQVACPLAPPEDLACSSHFEALGYGLPCLCFSRDSWHGAVKLGPADLVASQKWSDIRVCSFLPIRWTVTGSAGQMLQFLFLPSLLVIAAALALRWWFGVRIWKACAESSRKKALALRSEALDHWKKSDPKGAAARAGALRFGMATPPLSALVAVFAVLVGKLPPTGAIAVVLAMTAIACVFGFLSLPAELAALQRARNRDDPDHDSDLAAQAEAWNLCLPPALRAIFK